MISAVPHGRNHLIMQVSLTTSFVYVIVFHVVSLSGLSPSWIIAELFKIIGLLGIHEDLLDIKDQKYYVLEHFSY